MRILFIILGMLTAPALSHAQNPELDLLQMKDQYQHADTTVFVYMTAQWCKPCLDKMPALDAYFTATKRPYRLYYLFDRDKFQDTKLSKVFPFINFSGAILMAPLRFYPTGAVQVNGHRKMIAALKSHYANSDLNIQDLDKFDLGSLILYQPGMGFRVIDCPEFRPGTSIQDMDATWDNALR